MCLPISISLWYYIRVSMSISEIKMLYSLRPIISFLLDILSKSVWNFYFLYYHFDSEFIGIYAVIMLHSYNHTTLISQIYKISVWYFFSIQQHFSLNRASLWWRGLTEGSICRSFVISLIHTESDMTNIIFTHIRYATNIFIVRQH